MEFLKYQHVERLGTDETEGLLEGIVHIFYKIDGTNGSIWYDKENDCLRCGSRNRELSLEKDNAGFMAWVLSQPNILEYFRDNPNSRLYGEWLVPHSLKTYRDDAWRDFYVFDVTDAEGNHISYDDYKVRLDAYEINYIPPLAIMKNPQEDHLLRALEKTGEYLVEDGKGKGEGIVIKNYGFQNKYGRTIWGKIVTNEFKEVHHKEMGAPEVNNTLLVEERIVDKFLTGEFIKKEKSKIELDNSGWKSELIPQLLGRVWYEFIREESWNFIKEFKNPKVNYKVLNTLVIRKIKQEIGL